jgi:hypothetical protein
MKNTTKVAIAGLLSAAGAVLNAFATEFGSEAQPETAPAETPKRGTRKTGTAAALSAPFGNAETPATPAPAEAAAEPEAAAEGEGKTYDELRALIAPVVKDGQGEEVKKIIKKYAGEGGLLKTLEAKHHAAFEKDIAALSY